MNQQEKVKYLKQFWDDMVAYGNPGYSPKRRDERFNALISAYSEKNRYFHNVDHLVELFQNYEKLQDSFQTPEQHALAKAFIFYHDYAYDPAAEAGKNEYTSAAIAARGLVQMDFPATFYERTIYLVRASQFHKINEEHDPLGALLMDIDMMPMACDYDAHKSNSINILKEKLSTIKDDNKSLSAAFKAALDERVENFLKPTLARGAFNTKMITKAFGDQAKDNITQEIQDIKDGYYQNPKLYRDLEIH